MREPDPEDRRAWLAPGVFEVSPGVFRIPLPIPDTSLRGVNVYLVVGPDGPMLVDSGWARPETGRAFDSALADLGFGPQDLVRILVTHAHHDHYTEALALHQKWGTPVSLGRGEEPSIVAQSAADAHQERPDRLRRNGAPELARAYRELSLARTATDDAPWGPPQHWLDDGERVSDGARNLEVMATPGHTRGHIVLRDDAAGLLFSGDHVLPHITPSIGFDAKMVRYPLRDYLRSLQLVRGRPDLLLLPAHGWVMHSTHRRVDELLGHHADRLKEVYERVQAGEATAFAVARAIKWTRSSRHFDDLGDVTNQMLAVLEIEAHLDVLALDGLLVESEFEGVRTFRVI